MADISKITITDGTTYDIKDSVARREPIDTHTYTDVIATSNETRYATFFYAKFRGPTYNDRWRIVVRVRATVPGSASNAYLYNTDTTMELWGYANTYGGYYNKNIITNTSYRPVYYHSVFFVSQTGYNNNCGDWIGINLYASANPTNASYKRQIVVDLLECDGCTFEFSDTLYTPDTIPNRSAHTNWYTSTNTSFTNLDCCTQGVRMSGDSNSTTIHSLYRYQGNYVAHSALYRYQMLFHVDENHLTPLNNVSNGYGSTSKAMLTEVEFDPFMPIYYYGTTTTVNQDANIGAGALYWHYSGIDLRYTLNCGTTLTAHRPIYLVVTPTSDGKCKLASATPWSQTLPDFDDGCWYILLGRTYSTYQFTLYHDHPVYMYNGTTIVRVSPYTSITEDEIDAIAQIAAEHTITGDPVSFNTWLSDPLRFLSVPLPLVQNGSGTPSPSNVRPILGWDSFDVYRSGSDVSVYTTFPVSWAALNKNLLDMSVASQESWDIISIPNLLEPGVTYTVSIDDPGSFTYRLYASMADHSNNIVLTADGVRMSASEKVKTFVAPSNIKNYPYLFFGGNAAGAGTSDLQDLKLMCEQGSSATSYEPYMNTVYGGTVDVISGLLTIDKWFVDPNETTVNYSSSTSNTVVASINLGSSSLPTGISGTAVSNRFDRSIASDTPGRMVQQANIIYLVVPRSEVSTLDQAGVTAWFKTRETQIVYTLATPIVRNLTPQQIYALVGQNVFWANTGTDITVNYMK